MSDDENTNTMPVTGPVMLALSTFRQSEQAVDLALEKAREAGELVVVCVADRNLARYFVETDLGLFPGLKKKCEEDLLREHLRQAEEQAAAIAARAAELGCRSSTHTTIGRFGEVTVEVAEKTQPGLIVTTRSERPAWVRRFFGSPVEYLIEQAGCPVMQA